jgi:hypothetical protein
MNDGPHKSTEECIEDAVLQVQSASISKQTFHLNQVFTGDPSGHFAINSLFVVCGDELAPALHERLDATVEQFFKEHNIFVADSLAPDGASSRRDTLGDKVSPICSLQTTGWICPHALASRDWRRA